METLKDRLMHLFETFELVIMPPDILVHSIKSGQEFRADRIYDRLVELKQIPACINYSLFIKSAKTWVGHWVLVEKENILYLKRL